MNTLDDAFSWADRGPSRFRRAAILVAGSAGRVTARRMIDVVLQSQPEREHDYLLLELAPGCDAAADAPGTCGRPAIAVVTHVTDGQAGGLGRRKEVTRAAAELLAGVPRDGLAILGDDPWLRRFARDCRAPAMWIGPGPGCDLWASDIQAGPGSISFRVSDCRFHVAVWGRSHLASALAAIAVGRAVGMAADAIATALGSFTPLPARCSVLEVRDATVIHDPWSGTPETARAALEVLRDFDAPGRRILVCDELQAADEQAAAAHRELGGQAATIARADLLFACGRFAAEVAAAARAAGTAPLRALSFRTFDDVLPRLAQTLVSGDVALVAASRGLAMERVADALGRFPRRRAA